jgi:hypothetical protein
MSSIDGIASSLSDISSSSKGEVKIHLGTKNKKEKHKSFFSRKGGLDVSNQQN